MPPQSVFLTGGSGEIGRPAVAALVAEGREVTVAVRSAAAAEIAADIGAAPVELDLFDRDAVVVAAAGFAHVVHLATAIPPSAQMGDLATWVVNDRLRAETTAHLAAATTAGGGCLVLQSYFGVAAPRGAEWIAEPADREPAWSEIEVMDSMREAEKIALDAGGVVLRFGSLYSETSEQLQAQLGFLAEGTAAIPGDGENYWPYVASEDAGRAVASALDLAPGIYDVGDDEPLTLAEFWEVAAAAAGVPTPPHGDVTGHPMAPVLLGSWRTSNAAFRQASGWAPLQPEVRVGWPAAAERWRRDQPERRPS